MHWAEVRVERAFTGVHGLPCRRFASARRNHRTTQGELEIERASARVAARAGSACMNEHVGRMAAMLGAGSDTLQGATKPATLRCSHLDPIYLGK